MKQSKQPDIGGPYVAYAKSIERHAATEADALVVLERLATTPDPFMRLIAELVLEDERHHHALMLQIAKTMKSSGYIVDRAKEADAPLTEEAAFVAQREVAKLVRGEIGGIALLRALATQFLRDEDVSAQALTEWMVLDSEKHANLLTLLERHLKRATERAREERLHGASRVRQENDLA